MSHGKPFFNRMLADFRLPSYTVDHELFAECSQCNILTTKAFLQVVVSFRPRAPL